MKEVKEHRLIMAALVAVAVILFIACSAVAQSNPQGQGQQKPKSARQRLGDYYMEDDSEMKSFTYKQEPAFRVYKPNEDWHFIDISRYHGDQARASRTQQQRQQVENYFNLCKCIVHNPELDSEASVMISQGMLRKKLDLVMQEMEFSIKKSLPDYKRVSCKGKKKNGATGACLIFEGTPKGQPKDTFVWYFLVRGKSIYQLRMACKSDSYKTAKKDFDKIYRKWKF